MASLGQLVVNLEANIARFTSDMGRASEVTEQAMSKIDGAVEFGKKALGALGVALSVDVIVSEINRSLDSLAALDDMAQKTGSSVETLSKLSKVAAFTGTDLGAVDGMLVKLSKNLNDVDEKGNKTAKALAAIGISTDDLKGKDAAQVFVDITNKLQDYEDGAGKVALVTDLMGKSAADMLPFMNDVSESLDDFTADSAEAAAQAAAYQDELAKTKVKYDELVTSIVTAALPATTDFIGALKDTTAEANTLTGTTSVDSWADDLAVGLARVVDVAMLIPRTFGAVSGSFKAVAADIEFMGVVAENANPLKAALKLAQGGDPSADIRAALDKRNVVVEESNQKLADLWNIPANRMEQAVLSRISGRYDKQLADGADALAGMAPAAAAPRATIRYSSSDAKPTPSGGNRSEARAVIDVAPAIARMRDLGPDEAMAARMVELANDETLAMRGTIDVTDDLIAADTRRFEQKMRAAEQITAGAENIRFSLMSDAEAEQSEFDARIALLQAFSAQKLENGMTANALIEAETARHHTAITEMERQSAEQRMQLDMMVLNQAGGVADQMYSMLKQAGLEQTAVAKAAFLVSKGLAVAQIILSTNVAAAAALAPPPLGLGPVAGLGLAGTIKAMGYASAAMTAGMAVAEASAEGGYDIPAGTNPVTQLHEKEMVLPKAQAEVIRGLATNGGARGGGATITYSPQIHIDSRTDQGEVRKLVYTAVQQGNADLVDKLARAGRI